MDYQVREPLEQRLRLRDDLAISPRRQNGALIYVIEDRLAGKFFQTGAVEFALLRLFDGERTVRECLARLAAGAVESELTTGDALAVARWALETQVATTAASTQPAALLANQRESQHERWAQRFNPLAWRLVTVDPQAWLDALCAAGAERLIAWPVLAAVVAADLAAVWFVGTDSGRWARDSSALLTAPGWWTLAVVWTLLSVLHETLHALACRKLGASVRRAGVMLMGFAPTAFVDVTSAWQLPDRGARMAISAAGMVGDLALAAVAVFVWSTTTSGWCHDLALRLAWLLSVGTLLVNGNPFVRFDGYHILADLVEIPNLAGRGRAAVWRTVAEWGLGMRPGPALETGWRARFVMIYGWAALVWQLTVYVSLAILAVGFAGWLGGGLFAVWLLLWQIVPTVKASVARWRAAAKVPRDKAVVRRAALVMAGVAGLVVMTCFVPGRVSAPAVVEYRELAVVRVEAPGFVRRVLVCDGQRVEAGQPLVELENRELGADLSGLYLQADQAEIKCRMLRHSGERAKAQAEEARQLSLLDQAREKKQRVDGLTIRAPRSGTLVARGIEQWVGRYLATGDELGVLGDESAKELVVAVPQEDGVLFAARVGELCRLSLAGEFSARTAELKRVDPRAQNAVPHEALSSACGGPLAVRWTERERPGQASAPGECELLNPCFQAFVALSAQQAAEVAAGTRATVYFRAAEEPVAVRWFRLGRRWFDERVAAWQAS